MGGRANGPHKIKDGTLTISRPSKRRAGIRRRVTAPYKDRTPSRPIKGSTRHHTLRSHMDHRPIHKPVPVRPGGTGSRAPPASGPRPHAVTAAVVMCDVLALPMLFGAFLGLSVTIDGIAATGSDSQASNLIFGPLALVIAAGFAGLFLMGGFGLLRAGNPLPAQMASVCTCFVIVGAACRAFRFGSTPALIEFVVWLIAVVGVIIIFVPTNRPTAKQWLAAENRRWQIQRSAKRRHQQR